MTDRDLLDALRDCYAPNARRNLVTSALVQSATVSLDEDAPGSGIPGVPPRYIAHLIITTPDNNEDSNAHLRAHIENRLAGLEALSRVDLKLVPPLFSIL